MIITDVVYWLIYYDGISIRPDSLGICINFIGQKTNFKSRKTSVYIFFRKNLQRQNANTYFLIGLGVYIYSYKFVLNFSIFRVVLHNLLVF